MTDPKFWQGKKVFVTGHTGFKGSWLVMMLKMFGANVKGFSLAPASTPNLFEAAQVHEGIVHQIGDITDLKSLRTSLESFKPEIVLHLAAQALVKESYQSPLETYATNVMGTANLLEVIRSLPNIRSVVIVTTDKCYENREWLWPYRETEAMGGHDPYSSSKGCAELVTAAYRSSFFGTSKTKIATARAGNVIGGGDWAKDRLVPDLIQAFIQKKTSLIRSPNAVRPWQHVLEPVSAYLLLAEKLFTEGDAYAEAWNFGPTESDAKEVSYVVDQLTKQWGPSAKWEMDSKVHPHEASLLKLDISKARFHLGWNPKWNIDQCLKLTAQWYKDFYASPQSARDLCESQLKNYFGGQ